MRNLIHSQQRLGISLALITAAVVFMTPSFLFSQHRVVAYYPGWMKTKLPAPQVKFEYITHINHAFAWPTASGTITAYDEINHPELITEVHKAGRQILISLGGWGQSDGFSPMAADTNIRKTFIQNLLNFCTSRGYDGADIDWEFPATTADRANLTALIKQTREAFDQTDPALLLTMVAVAGDWNGKWHDYAKLAEYVDWFNLMAYDFHGSWTNHAGHNAPLYAPATEYDGSAHQAVLYLHNSRGIPKIKLHLGMPFYGREFNASQLYGPSTGGAELEYSSIVPRLKFGWDYFWDDVSKVPYLLNTSRTKVVTFDDSLSISWKCNYVEQNGLGGVMIWALGQDVLAGKQPLIEAVGQAMATATGISQPQPVMVKGFLLFDNYPNPFNPTTTISYYVDNDLVIKLSIYDVTGKLVTVLQNARVPRGNNSVTWDASDYASGIYFYELQSVNFSAVKKMTLVK